MTFQLTKEGRAMPWGVWSKKGGCGLSGMAAGEVGSKLLDRGKKFDLSGMTLGDIADLSVLAEREMARFAATHWPPLGLGERAGERHDHA